MITTWQWLEALPGLVAFPSVWRSRLREDFEPFNTLCLEPSQKRPISFPCPLPTSCAYRIVHEPDGSITGHCLRRPIRCQCIQLTPADITPLQLNWRRLGLALCKALSLNPRVAELNLFHTRQIGSWSADAVPVILTIQTQVRDLLFTVGLLTSRLRQKFILLAPTSDLVDASCKELLANWGAALFPLDSIVTLTPYGTLLPVKPPGELFANFLPDPQEPFPDAVPRLALDIVLQFNRKHRWRKAHPYEVFILYCAKGLSAVQIARECHCTVGLIFIRLRELRHKLRRDPAELRQYSGQFETILQSLSDHRARKIYRKGAIYGDDSEQALQE